MILEFIWSASGQPGCWGGGRQKATLMEKRSFTLSHRPTKQFRPFVAQSLAFDGSFDAHSPFLSSAQEQTRANQLSGRTSTSLCFSTTTTTTTNNDWSVGLFQRRLERFTGGNQRLLMPNQLVQTTPNLWIHPPPPNNIIRNCVRVSGQAWSFGGLTLIVWGISSGACWRVRRYLVGGVGGRHNFSYGQKVMEAWRRWRHSCLLAPTTKCSLGTCPSSLTTPKSLYSSRGLANAPPTCKRHEFLHTWLPLPVSSRYSPIPPCSFSLLHKSLLSIPATLVF